MKINTDIQLAIHDMSFTYKYVDSTDGGIDKLAKKQNVFNIATYLHTRLYECRLYYL